MAAGSTSRLADRLEIRIPQGKLRDLRERLARTRFASDLDNAGWTYGLPSGVLQHWVERWRDFNWRDAELRINAFEHFRATVNGSPIHFIHRRGRGPRPIPLLLCHGWPWTFWDWHETIDKLADPARHGGNPVDAFDVVVPSLPGYAFSPLMRSGLGLTQIADLLAELMTRTLGYERFGAAGGDQGSFISGQLGHKHSRHVLGIHLFGTIPMNCFTRSNPLELPRDWGFDPAAHHPSHEVLRAAPPAPRKGIRTAHLVVNVLEPQTLAAAMHDSPAGMLAWLLHRRRAWSDNDGDVLRSYTEEFLLTTFSLYWLTETFSTSIRTYYESAWKPWQPSHELRPVVQSPTGITFFDNDELTGLSRFWCGDYYNLMRASTQPRGGHFAPAEQPDIAVEEIRQTFRLLR